MNELKKRIEDCKSNEDLDKLRLEIVEDKENFLENQKAFIKVKNKIKKIPLRDRN